MTRKIELQRLPTTKPNQFVRVQVCYDAGGWSYLSGNFNKRGFYLSIQPISVEGAATSFTAFTGSKALISETPRFSERKLQEVALQVPHMPLYRHVLNDVLARNELLLGTSVANPGPGAVSDLKSAVAG